MPGELRVSDVEQINVFSRWIGFGHPPQHVAKLIATRDGERFVRVDDLTGEADTLPDEFIADFFEQLRQPAVESLDPTLFDVPEPVIRTHFDSMWTDDGPEVLLKLKFADGRTIDVLTTGQHAYLLPIKVRDSANLLSYRTFRPALSRSMAALMPKDFFQRDRLDGSCGMLQSDIEEYQNGTGTWRNDPDAERVPRSEEEFEEERLSWDEQQKRIQETLHRLHLRLEAPEDKEAAESRGDISPRLLKNLPLDEVADILRRGGNPDVVDETGHSALMLAAFPPLRREVFRMLADVGADLDARLPEDGATGLHLACCGGNADAVKEWVRAGADIHARMPKGATPLMLGANWLSIVRLLLTKGARVNDFDADGHTALVYAIHGQTWLHAVDQLTAMQLFLDAGVDLTRRDREGLTPLGFARRVHRRVLLEEETNQALQAARNKGRPLSEEEQQQQLELTKEMLRDIGSDVDPSKWNDLTMSEAVVNLIVSAGGTD